MHARRKIRRHRTHRSTKRIIRGHEADILAITAGIGVITTGVLAYNAGKKSAMLDISELSTKERIYAYLRILAPTMVASAATIGAIGTSRYFGRKREKDLLEVCALLSSYINRGESIEKKDARRGERSRVQRDIDLSDVEDTGTGDIIFIETFTGRKIKASMEVYEYATRKLQENFSICGIAPLNELYALMSAEETAAGEVLAWTIDQMVLDPYYEPGDDFAYDDALTKLAIQLHKVSDKIYEIHYNILPIGSLAGIGPCNY